MQEQWSGCRPGSGEDQWEIAWKRPIGQGQHQVFVTCVAQASP